MSDEVKGTFTKIYPEFADKTEVFHNLVDQDRIRRRAEEGKGFTDVFDGSRILTVGNLSPQKGYDIAIDAVDILKKRGLNIRWYVAGEGKCRAELEKKIADLGLENEFVLLGSVPNPYPYLKQVAEQLTLDNSDNRKSTRSNAQNLIDNDKTYLSKSDKPLVVRVFSFSYKKGIPQDESGNGGGYVFDCRSTHNPGRYEQYKKITGLEQPVIDFLEEDGEILHFMDSVYKLADFHVQRFLERGFTNLMFAFGCTGGQHRSVYAAQHLAEHINNKFGVEVHITHREQNIFSVLNQKKIDD